MAFPRPPPTWSPRRAGAAGTESRDIEAAKVAQLVGRGCPPETALAGASAPLDWTSRFAAERVR